VPPQEDVRGLLRCYKFDAFVSQSPQVNPFEQPFSSAEQHGCDSNVQFINEAAADGGHSRRTGPPFRGSSGYRPAFGLATQTLSPATSVSNDLLISLGDLLSSGAASDFGLADAGKPLSRQRCTAGTQASVQRFRAAEYGASIDVLAE
jgi:hypothetical protein